MIFLTFYLLLLLWTWLSVMLFAMFGQNGRKFAQYVFGDIRACLQVVVAPISLCGLMTGFYSGALGNKD